MAAKIRAHHGMCLAFFNGNGYSAEFTEHMWIIKRSLEKNPQVRILNVADDICTHCPGNDAGICKDGPKVEKYDNAVLKLCQLEAGAIMEWEAFSNLVQTKILLAGKRGEICKDCQWDALCKVPGNGIPGLMHH